MRAARLVAALSAAASLCAGLAACSGDDDAGDTPVVAATDLRPGPPSGWSDGGYTPDPAGLRCDQSAADPTRGITDTTITVGGLAYLTSPNGSTMAPADAGARARFGRANAEGGINGRTVDFTGTLDDANDATRNGSQARVLVDQKKVFAVVPVMTSHNNYLDTFCAETVPFFGWGTNAGYCDNTIGFGITGCQVPSGRHPVVSNTYGLMIRAMFDGDVDGRTTALVGVDGDSARAGLNELSQQIRSVGIDVVYAENPIPRAGVTDTTPIVNALMSADGGAPPDVVLYVADFNSVLRLTEAMNAAGYEGKHLNPVGYDPRLTQARIEGLAGSYTIVQWQPGVDTDVPAIRQLVADFAEYAPDTPISLPAMAGYWAADMFVRAATKVGRNLTVDALLSLLNSGSYTNYVEGAVPQTRFPVNHVTGAPCASLVQLNGDRYDITSDLACGSLFRK